MIVKVRELPRRRRRVLGSLGRAAARRCEAKREECSGFITETSSADNLMENCELQSATGASIFLVSSLAPYLGGQTRLIQRRTTPLHFTWNTATRASFIRRAAGCISTRSAPLYSSSLILASRRKETETARSHETPFNKFFEWKTARPFTAYLLLIFLSAGSNFNFLILSYSTFRIRCTTFRNISHANKFGRSFFRYCTFNRPCENIDNLFGRDGRRFCQTNKQNIELRS